MNGSKSRKVFLTRCMVNLAFFPAKRKLRIISSMLVVVLFGSNAHAQTGDWQAVENLKRGTRITVKARHRVPCIFKTATDDELVCKPPRLFFILGPAEARFDRQTVREVRIQRNRENDGWIGAGIGAGVGGAVGAHTGSAPRGGGAIVDALLGAFLGGMVAGAVPIFHHDKTIYRQ
jgi:hypothetical protein